MVGYDPACSYSAAAPPLRRCKDTAGFECPGASPDCCLAVASVFTLASTFGGLLPRLDPYESLRIFRCLQFGVADHLAHAAGEVALESATFTTHFHSRDDAAFTPLLIFGTTGFNGCDDGLLLGSNVADDLKLVLFAKRDSVGTGIRPLEAG